VGTVAREVFATMRSSGGFKSALARASFPNPRHDSHRKASCDGARGTRQMKSHRGAAVCGTTSCDQ
jgi:hypothetical protein